MYYLSANQLIGIKSVPSFLLLKIATGNIIVNFFLFNICMVFWEYVLEVVSISVLLFIARWC